MTVYKSRSPLLQSKKKINKIKIVMIAVASRHVVVDNVLDTLVFWTTMKATTELQTWTVQRNLTRSTLRQKVQRKQASANAAMQAKKKE